MWALGVIAGLLIVGVLTRHLLARDNVEPMERHLRALETLRDLAEQPRPPLLDIAPAPEMPTDHVRILDNAPADARPTRRAAAKRAPARAGTRRTAKPRATARRPEVELPTIVIRPAVERVMPEPAAEPVAFVAPVAPAAPAAPVAPVAAAAIREPRFSRERPAAIPSRIHAGAAAVATVVLAVGVLVAAGSSDHGTPHAAAKVTHNATPARPRAVSTPATSPPTTVATPVAIRMTRTTGGATVAVHTPFQLTLHANGTCWIQITDTSGRELFTTTLHSGQEQQIPGAQSIVVRLGYTPAITISVDGASLDLSGLSQTANVNFQTA